MKSSKNECLRWLTGTDALGRRVQPVSRFNDKQAGVFYFLWTGQHGSAAFDNSVLDIHTQRNDRGGEDVHHYWGKPLFGYYDSGDPWVFRKHLEMLTTAGVDYLVFDTTNSYYYEEVCRNIFPVALELLNDGWDIPRFVFDTNCRSSETVAGIYRAYYDPDTPNGKRFAPLWYRHPDRNGRNAEGKPWIIAKNNETGENEKYNYDALPKEIRDYFYLRESAWFEEDKVPYAFATDVDSPSVHEGMLSVSVAQHTSGAFSDSVFEEGARDKNRGRGYSAADKKNDAARIAEGSCFQEEWQRALDNAAVDNVFLTSWNEWVAQKQPFGLNGRSCCYFVDQYNTEFSRDIEPADNELGDNYYMQMLINIRKFKCADGLEPVVPACSADIRGGADSWKNATAYWSFAGDGANRDYKSANYALPPYRQAGAVNDVTCVRVACDKEFVYVRTECGNDISPQTSCGKHLNVHILREDGAAFTINAQARGNTATVTETTVAERTAGLAERVLEKNALSFRIPREVLGLSGNEVRFSFKVTDGLAKEELGLKCYAQGKSVPVGRLYYAFRCKLD